MNTSKKIKTLYQEIEETINKRLQMELTAEVLGLCVTNERGEVRFHEEYFEHHVNVLEAHGQSLKSECDEQREKKRKIVDKYMPDLSEIQKMRAQADLIEWEAWG